MRILITGQLTLHWGRLEFGNIGNYYIIEPFFRELHRVFPNAVISTTFQMTDEFCLKESIAKLPLELYYSWDDEDYLKKSLYEYSIAELYNKTGTLVQKTPYIKEVLKADLVIDFSGDLWSDNADFVGPNRFLTGLLKDRTSQLLGKKTVMLSGSPAPFENHNHAFTKEVFEGFNLVTNRENVSVSLLTEYGFSTSNVKNFACPAFIFEPSTPKDIEKYISKYELYSDNFKTGFILCGWNLSNGPYSRTDIHDEELNNHVELLEHHINRNNSTVYLMSHSNGFDLPPCFHLKHGRDFLFASQLFRILKKRGKTDISNVFLIEDVLSPKETKAIIGQFDMLISGRIHAAVAGLSQAVPTMILDYGHGPKAHKLVGFAEIAGVQKYIANPSDKKQLFDVLEDCFVNRVQINNNLKSRMELITQKVSQSFDVLKELF